MQSRNYRGSLQDGHEEQSDSRADESDDDVASTLAVVQPVPDCFTDGFEYRMYRVREKSQQYDGKSRR